MQYFYNFLRQLPRTPISGSSVDELLISEILGSANGPFRALNIHDSRARVPLPREYGATSLRCAGNISVNRERIQKRLGVGICRVPSDQEKDTKPTLGWRACRELQRLEITLLRICGKIGDRGLAVNAEHHGRGRSLGGRNKTLNMEIDFHCLVVVAFERQDERKSVY